jgi:homocysteine S-methyltransferase
LRLTDKLPSHKPLLVVELKPDDPNLLRRVEQVKPYVDAVRLTALKNSADLKNPKRTAEQICFESAINVARRAHVDVIASLVCRDHLRNDSQVLSDLNQAGVDNLLALYGDPNDPPYPNNYEFQSSGDLIRWIRKQESRGESGGFCIAVGADPTSKDVAKQISTIREKREAGADLAITQPVFHSDQVLISLKALEEANEKLPLLIGLLVPKSEKSIAFLEQRLGVSVSPTVKEKVRGKGLEEGFQVIREVYRTLRNKAAGYYIYPWADPKLTVVTALLRELREQA